MKKLTISGEPRLTAMVNRFADLEVMTDEQRAQNSPTALARQIEEIEEKIRQLRHEETNLTNRKNELIKQLRTWDAAP